MLSAPVLNFLQISHRQITENWLFPSPINPFPLVSVFTPRLPLVSSINQHSFNTPNPLDTFLFPHEQRRNVFVQLYGSHQSPWEACYAQQNPHYNLCKTEDGGVGGNPASLSSSNALKKTCVSAEIHIGKWISHLKHCFSLREAFNPLKFLSNLPWKCLSQEYNSDDITDLIY